RVVGAMRVGDVTHLAGHDENAVLRTPAPKLDGVAQFVDVARLAEHAMVEFFALRRGPFQELGAAVDGDAFFIAGDEKRDRPAPVLLRLAAVGGKMIERGSDLAGDRALHVYSA